MKLKLKTLTTSLLLALAAAFAASPLVAQPREAPSPAAAELRALLEKTGAKVSAGQSSVEALAPELAEFEKLRAKYRGKDDTVAAQVAYMHAGLFAEVIGDYAKARALFLELKKDFPSAPQAANVDEIVAQLDRAAALEKAKTDVIGRPAPALTFQWSTREGLKSLADLKGKVVVIDFWATWCGPCIASFPEVRALAERYKGLDVVVLGVTSLQGFVANLGPEQIDTKDDPKREQALMRDFVKAHEITWPIVFSEQPVFNEAYGVSGIPHMAIVAPDGKVRYNGIHPGAPQAEKVEKIDALLKEFGKKTKA